VAVVVVAAVVAVAVDPLVRVVAEAACQAEPRC